MQPLSGNQRPDLLTSLMNMSFVLRLPREMHLGRFSSNVPRLPWFLEMQHVLLTFDKVHNPLRLPRETTSEHPKVVRACGVLCILTSKRASRHNGVHFFDISTSKSGPTLVCFVHFDFKMCFAPQRRALFRHLNFQKWSDTGVFCTFWLQNVLRATTACTFSTSQLPKVVRHWCVLYILTSKCASRHIGVHFFIIWPDGSAPAALASLLFDPEPQIIGKTQCCASASSFFWLFLFYHLLSSALLFSLPLPSSAFHLSILSEVWLLNFLRLCLGCDCFLPGWIRLILSHCILIISPVYGIEFIDFAALSICCFMVFISLPILDTLQKVNFLADERRYPYSSG